MPFASQSQSPIDRASAVAGGTKGSPADADTTLYSDKGVGLLRWTI